MNGTAHASYSFLIFCFLAFIITGSAPSGGTAFLSLLSGIIPDLDGIYWRVSSRGNRSDNTFQHHLYYPTHWPVTYLPLVAWTVIAFAVEFFPMHTLAVTAGVYAHLAADSVSCGDGMNWGAPWGKRFVNLCSATTDGYHGRYWSYRYRKTPFFVLENVAASCSLVLLAWFSFTNLADVGWYVFGMAGIAGFVVVGFLPVAPEFALEPPGGRYDDYRRIPVYFDRLPPRHKARVQSWWSAHGLDSGPGSSGARQPDV